MNSKNLSIFILFSILISGCINSEELKLIGREPEFTQTILPVDTSHLSLDTSNNFETAEITKNTNSLWKPGSRDFFRDRRARSVGDILKVKISIKDNAKLDNKTTRDKNIQENSSAPNILGFEKSVAGKYLPKALNLSNLINLTGTNSHSGVGKIDRKEDIQTEIAATVMRILPSGTLIIQGKQEVRVNYELREITVSGIIRPEDIGADNSIGLDQIAEARVSYGGRGTLTKLQKPRYGGEIVEIISPF